MQFADLVAAFIVAYDGRDTTLPSRLAWWRAELGHLSAVAIDADTVDAALMRLAQRGRTRNVRGRGPVIVPGALKPATMNRYRAALASVLKWARKRRIFPRTWRNPMPDVPQEPEDNARDEFLTMEQVDRLVTAARMARWKKLPVLIQMAFTTGLRRGALEELRWRDVDLDAGLATVTRTKNGRPHVAVLTPAVIEGLRAMRPSNATGAELVFCGRDEQRAHRFDGAYKRALADARLPAVTFHALRHSCATHLARSGVSLHQIADVMAHRSLVMTRRYSHHLVADRQRLVTEHFA